MDFQSSTLVWFRCVSCFSLIVLWTAAAAAEDEEVKEIVVRATPYQETASVTTVDREEIERQGGQNVVELLRDQAAIFASTGSRGEASLSLRGFYQRQLAVLIDGLPTYIPYDGLVNLGAVPVEWIDHVTVVKGPGSVMFGPNGLGGVINIVTRRPGAGPLFRATFEAGRYGAFGLRALHSHRLGSLGYVVGAGVTGQDGFGLSSDFAPTEHEDGGRRENSDRVFRQAFVNSSYRWDEAHSFFTSAWWLDGAKGISPSTQTDRPRYWRFTQWRAWGVSLGHRGRWLGDSLDIDEVIYVRGFDNLLDSYDDDGYQSQLQRRSFHSWYHDQIIGGRLRLRSLTEKTPWGPSLWRLWAGFQYDSHHEQSGEQEPSQSLSRTIVTLAPELETHFGRRWILTVSLQTDFEIPNELPTESPHKQIAVNPLLSLQYQPALALQLAATVARRTRFPSLKERFASAGGQLLPNPALRPEHAWHFGLEANWQAHERVRLLLGFFAAELDDLIASQVVNFGPDAAEQTQNLGQARMLGAEVELAFVPRDWVQLKTGAVYLHARRQDQVESGDRLAYLPATKIFAGFCLRPKDWVELSSRLRLIGPRDFMHPATGDWDRLGWLAAVDARLAFLPLRELALWLRATNVLDRNNQSEFGYPAPGWGIWLGLSVSADKE